MTGVVGIEPSAISQIFLTASQAITKALLFLFVVAIPIVPTVTAVNPTILTVISAVIPTNAAIIPMVIPAITPIVPTILTMPPPILRLYCGQTR